MAAPAVGAMVGMCGGHAVVVSGFGRARPGAAIHAVAHVLPARLHADNVQRVARIFRRSAAERRFSLIEVGPAGSSTSSTTCCRPRASWRLASSSPPRTSEPYCCGARLRLAPAVSGDAGPAGCECPRDRQPRPRPPWWTTRRVYEKLPPHRAPERALSPSSSTAARSSPTARPPRRR